MLQPPKRRAAEISDTSGSKPRLSKLAKENNITAQEENEIKEAFSLFSEPMDGEKEGVIPVDDVKRALMSVFPILPEYSTARIAFLAVSSFEITSSRETHELTRLGA
jgi:Ca2+-binding EF-hand superfamily protein